MAINLHDDSMLLYISYFSGGTHAIDDFITKIIKVEKTRINLMMRFTNTNDNSEDYIPEDAFVVAVNI